MKFEGSRLSTKQVTALSFFPVGIPFTLEDIRHVCHERTLASLVDKGIISYIDGAYLLEFHFKGARHTIPPKTFRNLCPDEKRPVQKAKIEVKAKNLEVKKAMPPIKPVIVEIEKKSEPPMRKIETLNTMAWK